MGTVRNSLTGRQKNEQGVLFPLTVVRFSEVMSTCWQVRVGFVRWLFAGSFQLT
jgi:hypothetical protein